MPINFKRYFLYLIRWQLSTPILAGSLAFLSQVNQLTATIIANFIGGLIFFWVDRFIFTTKSLDAQWEVKEHIKCSDCKKIARGYRLVKTANYDMANDPRPKFRCENCSKRKTLTLQKLGIAV